jgi:hypothetical protein
MEQTCGYSPWDSTPQERLLPSQQEEAQKKLLKQQYMRDHYQKNKPRKLQEMREYRKKNREKLLQYMCEYNHKNKERILSDMRTHYQRNREKILRDRHNNQERRAQYGREHYKKNRSSLLVDMRHYFQNNRDKILEYQRVYYEKNQDKIKELQRKVRCQKKTAAGLPPPRKYSSWKSVEDVRNFFKNVAELYHIQSWPGDWYRISAQQVQLAGGMPPFNLLIPKK